MSAFVCCLPSTDWLELRDVPCLLRSHRIGLLRVSRYPDRSPVLAALLNEQPSVSMFTCSHRCTFVLIFFFDSSHLFPVSTDMQIES